MQIPKTHALATAEFNTIRLRLLKLGARIIEMASRVRLAFAVACPDATLIRHIAAALNAGGAVNDGAAIAPVTRPENLQRLPKTSASGETDASITHAPRRASAPVRLPPGTAANNSG